MYHGCAPRATGTGLTAFLLFCKAFLLPVLFAAAQERGSRDAVHGLAARKARGPQQGKLVLQRQRRVEVDEHIRRDVRASPAARAFRPQQSLLFLAAGDVVRLQKKAAGPQGGMNFFVQLQLLLRGKMVQAVAFQKE